MVSLLWKSLTSILFVLGMVLTRLSVFVLLKSDLCAHDCAQKLVESEAREAAEHIQSFFLFKYKLNNYYYNSSKFWVPIN